MKKILSATLGSLMLLTAATGAASARPWGHGGRHDNTGAYVAAGIGLFALGAILASSSHHERYDEGYGYRELPPPPPRGYYDRYGYDRGYDRYDDRY